MTTPSWSFHSFIINLKLNILVEMDLWIQVPQVSPCTSFFFLCVCVSINLHCRKKAPLGNFYFIFIFRTTDLQNCFIFSYKLVTQHLLLVENLLNVIS